MSKSNETTEYTKSLLPHERAFVLGALSVAKSIHKDAQLAYGEAVASSGGDWVFDDPASQAALQEAGMKAGAVAALKQLSLLEIADYPNPESDIVAAGSRVSIEIFDEVEIYDVVSRRIPGFPQDPEVLATLSAESASGVAIIGSKPGDTVSWEAVNGRTIGGLVVSVNQEAQVQYYRSIGLKHHSEAQQ